MRTLNTTMFSSAVAASKLFQKLHFTLRSYKSNNYYFKTVIHARQIHLYPFRVLWSNYGIRHFFKSRWFETVNRFGHSELLPSSNFYRTYHSFLFTGEVIYCLIVKTYFKRLSLCGYQFTIIRLIITDFILS